jgi:hypothetical protein
MQNKTEALRSIYLYLVSLVGIIMFIFSLIALSRTGIGFLFHEGNNVASVSNMAKDVAAIIMGAFMFLFHWRIIQKESRFSTEKDSVVQQDDNFWGSLFFYALSFLGLMVFAFSFIGIAGALFDVNWTKIPVSTNPKIPGNSKPPLPNEYLYVNVEGVLKSSVSFIIGMLVWILPWRILQKSRKEQLRKNES